MRPAATPLPEKSNPNHPTHPTTRRHLRNTRVPGKGIGVEASSQLSVGGWRGGKNLKTSKAATLRPPRISDFPFSATPPSPCCVGRL